MNQGKSQDRVWCEVADEAVVVKKFRPVKPGNSVEDKTETTAGGGSADCAVSKALYRCEERVVIYIDDTAGGIAYALLQSLFDPYATGEFRSRNKGLSLHNIRRVLIERY